MPMLLNIIPAELRLLIYDFYLEGTRRIVGDRQPTNSHYSLLHTSRQLSAEAAPLLRRYLSLRNERQICVFIRSAEPYFSLVRWVDVPCDDRLLRSSEPDSVRVLSHFLSNAFIHDSSCNQITTPVSQLHLALCKMSSLQAVRVFNLLK
jgi:hypothetical protein